MPTHRVRIEAREQIAEGTIALRLSRPAGFHFLAGQAITLALPAPRQPDGVSGHPLRHAFSIASAPTEDHIAIATRMRDTTFKQALHQVVAGSNVEIDGPFGNLCLHRERRRAAVFLAGGIGVTPFMSILRQAARDHLPQRLVLVYSNRRPEDAAYLSELQQLRFENPNFRLIVTITRPHSTRQPWDGRAGHITAALVREASYLLSEPIFYVVGPPAMVGATRTTLQAAGVDADDVRTESFHGY